MPSIGAPELIILLLVVLLLFGSTRLPKLARSMGEASREFKKGVTDVSKSEPADVAPASAPAEEKVTLTRTELDALMDEREAQVRKESPPSS
jgi:sec-independent protein translocase protein TatA